MEMQNFDEEIAYEYVEDVQEVVEVAATLLEPDYAQKEDEECPIYAIKSNLQGSRACSSSSSRTGGQRKRSNPNDATLFRCSMCSKYFISEIDLRRHLLRFHSSVNNPSSAKLAEVSCELCMARFRDAIYVKRHFTLWHSDAARAKVFMEFECTECANILASLHLLEKHMHIIHKLSLWTPVEHEIRRYYGCRICLRRGFRTSQLLIDHQRLAHRVQRDQGDTLAGDEQREDAVMIQRLSQCEFCTLVFRDPKMHKIHRDLHLDARQPISKNSVKTIRIDDTADEEGSSDEDGVPFTVDDEDDEEENGVDKDEDDYYADEYLNADLIPNNRGEQHSIHNDIRKLYRPRRIIGGGRGSRGSHVKRYPRFCCVFCRKPLQSAEELREHMVDHNNINSQVEARTGASTSMVGLRNWDEIPMGQSKPGPGRPRKNFSVPIIVRRSRKRVGILERLEAKKSKENLEGELIGMPPDSVDEGNGDCTDGKAEKDNFSRRSTRLAKPNRKQNLSNLSRGRAIGAAISVPMNDMQINEKETGHIPADMPELIIHD